MRLTRTVPLLLVFLLVCAGRAQALVYEESFDPAKLPEQVLSGTLLLGEEGSWSGRLADGRYVLTNERKPDAVEYFYLGTKAGLGQARVQVEVSVDAPGEAAGAGILYRFDPERKTYLGFLVLPGGKYAVIERDEQRAVIRMSGMHDAIEPGANQLTVASDGGAVRFSVNGTEVATINTGAAGVGAGILAFGIGQFSFDNFAMSTP
jgi:hypothetical protein